MYILRTYVRTIHFNIIVQTSVDMTFTGTNV